MLYRKEGPRRWAGKRGGKAVRSRKGIRVKGREMWLRHYVVTSSESGGPGDFLMQPLNLKLLQFCGGNPCGAPSSSNSRTVRYTHTHT